MPKKKILIVEDEILVAESLRIDLEKFGFAVLKIVDTGEKAVSSALTEKPDVVLMDITLKGTVNGIEAAEEITRETGGSVPIIILTGYGDKDWHSDWFKENRYEVLLKPINEKKLADTINKLF